MLNLIHLCLAVTIGMLFSALKSFAADTTTTIDVSPLLSALGPIALPILAAVAVALLHRVSATAKGMHLLQSDKATNDALDAEIVRAAAWASAQIANLAREHITFDTHSQVAAQAVELVKDMAPSAIAALGLDEKTIHTRIRMALGDPMLAGGAVIQGSMVAAPASQGGGSALSVILILGCLGLAACGLGPNAPPPVEVARDGIEVLLCGDRIVEDIGAVVAADDKNLTKAVKSAGALAVDLAQDDACRAAKGAILRSLPPTTAPDPGK